MRDCVLVVTLMVWLVVQLLLLQPKSVQADQLEPDELIAAALGGSTVQ